MRRPSAASLSDQPMVVQRPLISIRSTSEAVAAWIGRRTDRAGPTPTPSNETGGAPDDVPALTTRLLIVNGSRFSTLSVVRTQCSTGRLHRDESARDRPIDRLGQCRPSRTLIDELSRNETLPSGSHALGPEHELDDHGPSALAVLGVGKDHFEKDRRGRGGGKRFGFNNLERKSQKSQAVELAGQALGITAERTFTSNLHKDA